MSASPLDRLTELARQARDQAGQQLADERRGTQQILEQLEMLQRYRQEYAAKLQVALRDGIDPATMHNYQRFLASLDDSLERARQALAAQQQRVDQRQRHWQQRQRTLSSYDTLAERRTQAQRRVDQRREQRLNDDLANRRRSPRGPTGSER